jgi:hypothetical protein
VAFLLAQRPVHQLRLLEEAPRQQLPYPVLAIRVLVDSTADLAHARDGTAHPSSIAEAWKKCHLENANNPRLWQPPHAQPKPFFDTIPLHKVSLCLSEYSSPHIGKDRLAVLQERLPWLWGSERRL